MILVQKTQVPVNIHWLKDEKPIVVDNQKYVSSQDVAAYSFSIQVTQNQVIDAGTYTVVVSNSYGKSTSSARLLVRCKISVYFIQRFFFIFHFFNFIFQLHQ